MDTDTDTDMDLNRDTDMGIGTDRDMDRGTDKDSTADTDRAGWQVGTQTEVIYSHSPPPFVPLAKSAHIYS